MLPRAYSAGAYDAVPSGETLTHVLQAKYVAACGTQVVFHLAGTVSYLSTFHCNYLTNLVFRETNSCLSSPKLEFFVLQVEKPEAESIAKVASEQLF